MAKSKRSNVKKHHRKVKAESIEAAEVERINKMSEKLIGDTSTRVSKDTPLTASGQVANLGMKSQLVRRFKKKLALEGKKKK